MGFLSELTRTWTKALRLQKLQKAITSPNRNVLETASDLSCLLGNDEPSKKGRALEEYFDLCESDDGVKRVMAREDLSRFDLKGIVVRLLARGLGEWIQGHYIALSTIAYAEPLQYFIYAEKRGVGRQQISFDLLEYWEGRITARELLQQIPEECEAVEPQMHDPGEGRLEEKPTDMWQRTLSVQARTEQLR